MFGNLFEPRSKRTVSRRKHGRRADASSGVNSRFGGRLSREEYFGTFSARVEMLESRKVMAAVDFSGSTYTQDFQSLTATALTPATVSSTTMLEVSTQSGGGSVSGWYVYHQAAGTPRWGRTDGSSNTGSFFAMYDAQSTPNRALGSQGSSSLVGFFGVVLKNTSGSTINTATISFDAVMNRNPASTANQWPASYRVSGTNVVTSSSTADGTFNDSAGIWTSSTNLSFTTPSSGTGAPNATQSAISPLFRIGGTAKSDTLTGLNWGNNQFLYVRWKETDETGSDATAGVDNFSISLPAPSPTITGAATAAAFTTTYGTASAAQSFAISGSNLTADLVATAPPGFEVSSDGTTYGSTATFTQSGGSASGTLRVRLAATAAVTGTYNALNIGLSSAGATTVNIVTASSGNAVTAKALTITGVTIADKTYDGTTSATVSGTPAYSGLVNGESFSVTGTATATFGTAGVGTGKSVTVVGYTAPSTNYTVSQPSATGNVTARSLTVTATNVTKTAGQTLTGGSGSTAFTSSGLAAPGGVAETIGSVTIAYGTGADAGAAVGTYTGQVTPSAATGGTFDPNNYSISYVAGDITVSAAPTISPSGTLSGVTTTYGTPSSATTFTVSGGFLTGDLTVAAPTGFQVSSDGTTYGSSVTLVASSGTVASTTISVRLAAATAVGTYSGNVVISGGSATTQNVAVPASTVSAATLTITGLTGVAKEYDGLLAATVTGTPAFSGLQNGETFTVSDSITWTYGTKTAGAAKTLVASGSFTAPSANYTVTQPTVTAGITAKSLTVTGAVASNKPFDGTTAAVITGATLVGVVSGDTVTVGGGGTFAQAGAGAAIPVTAALTLGGADGGNYSLTQPTGLAADIFRVVPLAAWNFDSPTPDTNTATGTQTPVSGTGTVSLVGGTTGTYATGSGTGTDNSGFTSATYPAQGTGSGTAGVRFSVPTNTPDAAAATAIVITFDFRQSSTTSRFWQLQLSSDGTTFVNASGGTAAIATQVATTNTGTSFGNDGLYQNNPSGTQNYVNGISYTLTGSNAAAYINNANFAWRWVSVFQPTTSNYISANAGTTTAYATGGTGRFDNVSVQFLAGVAAPSVGTPTSGSITDTAATLGGTVASDGGSTLTETGIVYAPTATNANPAIGGTGVIKVAAGTAATGAFTVPVTGLTAGTGYSFKAYATNAQGTTYTTVASFATLALPVVGSPSATGVTASGATLGGTVTSDGGTTVTERGVVYALTADSATPTIGATGVTKVAVAGGVGVFTTAVSGLAASSGYSYRAYVTNSVGTTYSDVGTFSTIAQTFAPTVSSATVTAVISSGATLGGTVESDGGDPITERGIVYAVTGSNPNPTIGGTGVTKVTVTGTTGLFTTNVTGLTGSTGYSFRAYATNGQGTTYTSAGTFTTTAATTTTLTGVTPLTSAFGTSVTFAGTVVAGTDSTTPAGTIEIRNGGPTGTLLASTTTIGGTGASGTFSVSTSSIAIGSYSSVQAFFVAASGFDSSSSSTFGSTLTVTPPPFTPGNLLVLQVGDGTTTITYSSAGNAFTGGVTLLEYTPTGTLVQAIPVASSGTSALTLRLNSTSEGTLSLSGDRQSVTFGGHRVDVGATNPNTSTTPRVIGKVSATGMVDTSQAIANVFTNDSFRSVVTDNGTNFWMSGAGTNSSGGIEYVAGPTATTATALSGLTNPNTRQIQIIDGNLFTSSGSATPGRSVWQVGSGLPTTGGQTLTSTFAPAASAQYQSFYFADLDAGVSWRNTGFDTLYATDSSSGAVVKFSFVVTAGVGAWTARGSIAFAGAGSLVGYKSGSDVVLYVTSTTTANGVSTVTDTTGYNADFSTMSLGALATPVTVGANYGFRGISFVPRAGVTTTTTVTNVTPTAVEAGTSVSFTATVAAGTGTATPTGSVQFRSGDVLLATAPITGSGATGTATVSTTAIPFGTYANITAQYVPDGNPSGNLFNPSTSAAYGTSLVVTQPGVVTTTTLANVTWAASPAAAAYGDQITFTGTVATADSSTPVGTVEIRDGGPTGTLLASGSVFGAGGSFSITTTSAIPSGTYGSMAAYFVAVSGYKNSTSSTSATSLTISQTTLGLGDIAITGYQATGTDKVTFVLLKDVIAGTTFTLTDAAWTGTALASSEGTSRITLTQPFTAGTLFDFDYSRADGVRWQWGANTAAGGSTVGIQESTSTGFALNATGDNLFVYQGAVPTTGTAAGWIAAFSSTLFLTTGSAGTDQTFLPAAFTEGVNAFSLGLAALAANQNGGLNDLGTVTASAAGIRTAVYTLANWTISAGNVAMPSPTRFVIGSPTVGTTGGFTAVVTTAGTASTATTITVTGSSLSGAITATAPTGFEVSSDGTTYGATATFTPVSGAVSGTLSLRLAATTAVGSYSGSVSLASTGATTVTVAVPASTVTSTAVKVTGLFVRGATWNTGYLGLSNFTTVGTDQLGWGLRDGVNQLATNGVNAAQVTWTNVNRLSVQFNQAIATPAADAVKLIRGNASGDVTLTPTGVTMLAANTVAQFAFASALETGSYLVSIAAGGIADAAGTTVLDGEWTNSSSTFAAGSGDGTEGGSFDYRFNVVAGDVNASGSITNTDRSLVVAQLFQTIGSSNFRANLDGSASITNTDTSLVVTKLFQVLGSLPNTPVAAAPAVTSPTVAAVTSTTAELGGRLVSTGGSDVTERGIVILAGSTGTPSVGDQGVVQLLASGTSLGVFTVSAQNLTASTTYRFRAFARNALGISYSEIRTFTTAAT